MEIYVRSRGFSQENGYCWVPQTPSILTTNRVTELIQSEAHSLVLARYGRQLLLLVTGLEAKGRLDFRDRKIRNSIAWVGEDSPETSTQLRAIAVRALRSFLEADKADNLDADIDRAIVFGGADGFQVSWEELSRLSDNLPRMQSSGNLEREREELATDKVGNNCDFLKEDLAEILECYALPKREGVLVVVTGIKSEEAIVQAGVWRGLSKTISTQDWKTVRERKYPPTTPNEPLGKSNPLNETATLVAAIVGIAMVLFGWLWF
ncbi:hypothetical protein [Phormidium sp. CCY1219]|uniref:hypothetical protein n=1 Tax=Phormidium sp. CCY1219 TaxID=2886104 RepID=UPI002D1ED9DD|nr:hypothetical protein [Phormidium sp. CCY1219]MEB3828553.1 hypothetical protein [Phormidium sp. CCY1219]